VEVKSIRFARVRVGVMVHTLVGLSWMPIDVNGLFLVYTCI
jgi:hypothetical protein